MSESELIAAFLARGGQVQTLPTRRPACPSMEWAGYEYGDAEQPVPPIGRVRHIVAVQQKEHAAAVAARKAEAGL